MASGSGLRDEAVLRQFGSCRRDVSSAIPEVSAAAAFAARAGVAAIVGLDDPERNRFETGTNRNQNGIARGC
jgi:hypothetical protein